MKRTPLAPGKPLRRKTRLRSVGAKARREAPSLAAFRAALEARSGGWCEARTPACPPGMHPGHHAHHCAPSDRDRGVHDPARGLWLCFPAHAFVHREPAVSYRNGWLLRDGAA